jgi:DNA invertase Pin-like site-specific DNA recombinase
MSIKKIQAISYLRSSSAANVADEKNPDRDSDKRQRAAIAAYAKRAGIQIVDEYYDEAVSGADHIDTRPGFKAMLERLLSNGIRTIVVETANRFARDLMVQEVGFAMLKERGITLISADSPDAFLDDTPTSRLIRQVLGSVSEFEKAMLVSKLRGARERKRANGHKVEGRKSHAEARPEVVALAKTLRQRLHRGHAMSFRNISAELLALGHASKSGKAFTASSVRKMLV